MTTITIDRELLEEVVEIFDNSISTRYPHQILSDIRAALAAPATAPKPFPHEDMDKVALARYTVAKSKSTIWPCSVVAGDGEQELFSGSESTCKHVARKLTGAFLDGAFYAHSTTALLSEAETQDLRDIKEAVKAALAAPATAPAWHDAPTVPGLWLARQSNGSYTTHSISDDAITHGIFYRIVRWFGPIPEDTK